MSLAEELLATISEDGTVHKHSVSDPDNYFEIDPDSRAITNASQTRNTLMQRDHKSEIYTIALPRIVEGHDMTKCNRVRVHFINIDPETNAENPDVAELDSPVVDPKDSSKAIVKWCIRREATQLAGILSFAVQYECVETDGTVDYEFHSDYYSDVDVKVFRDNGEASVIRYSNVLEDWYQKIFGLENSLIKSVTDAAEAQKESIRLKGEETLATIPADYTTTHNMAEEALRKKANAIELEAEGEVVLIDNSADAYLLGLNLYGKTTQAADPTPDNPQELVSIGSDGTVDVTISGKNLLNIHRTDIGKISTTAEVSGESITVATAVDNTFARAVIPVTYPVNTPLTISFDATILQGCDFMSPHAMPVYMRKGNATSSTHVNLEISTDKRSYAFTIPDGLPEAGYSLWLYIKTSADFVGAVEVKYENIQIEVGFAATEYEAYVEPKTLVVNTPNGLPGIPVNSAGNYTDANGQQWICDEIDFERGVFVQRVGRKTLNGVDVRPYYATHSNGQSYCAIYPGDNTNSSPAMSSHYAFSPINWSDADKHLYGIGTAIILNDSRFTDADSITGYWAVELPEVQYVLAAPIETALTDEEIAYYKQLKTYYHNTTVLNDAGAHMSVAYNADTKMYFNTLLGVIENGSY